ncbi:hypothetical protein [Leptolyngbya sp. FACHB-261]|uniref:hypothetical protein n=1 Tax=Leptolyngbya sp. FACHB-261 TaxID=2692806 RepID=UPI0016843B12|nr:hypothetical protein [Leptolyngbya sp. FACHB-261]MBD2099647.1 hypothetical protein [Leptolyngbya sp. FACHB-261]
MTKAHTQAVTCGYRPGAIGKVAQLHGTDYAEYRGLGSQFEAQVVTELGKFCSRFELGQDGF